MIFDQFSKQNKKRKKYEQIKNEYTLKIMKILRTASQGSNFTGSYKKNYIDSLHSLHSYEMFSKSNFQYSDCLCLKPEHWRWNFAQQIPQMMHLSPLSSSQSSSHSWHCHCSSSLLLILPIYNLFLLETFLLFAPWGWWFFIFVIAWKNISSYPLAWFNFSPPLFCMSL